MDSKADLEQARRRLSEAYETARAVDYLPGSAQMRRLADAESGYQRARERYEREAR